MGTVSPRYRNTNLGNYSIRWTDFWARCWRVHCEERRLGLEMDYVVSRDLLSEIRYCSTQAEQKLLNRIATIMALVIFAIALPTTCETLAPVVLQRKAARLRFQTKNWALHSKRDEEPVEFKALARKYGIKPLQMLVQEPILLAMTCFMALVYALIYLAFFAFPYSFSVVRGWEIGVSALPFFGLLIGYLIGFLLSYLESTIRFQRLLREKHGEVAPEERLPPMILGSFILIAGMFWFAWTSFPSKYICTLYHYGAIETEH